MKHICLAVLLFAAPAFAVTMSHEEAVVREAYAKLAYAADVASVQQVVDSQDQGEAKDQNEAMQKIAANKLEFRLSDFKIGNIADIKGYYDDYVAEPDGGYVLSAGPSTNTTTVDNVLVRTSLSAQVQWTQGPRTAPNAWKVSAVSNLSRELEGITYQRYASYRVILKFQGRQRDYRALAVFAPARPGFGTVSVQDNQSEDVLFVDFITGNSALTFFAKPGTDISPYDLRANRDNPIVAEWLRKNQPPSSEVQAR